MKINILFLRISSFKETQGLVGSFLKWLNNPYLLVFIPLCNPFSLHVGWI